MEEPALVCLNILNPHCGLLKHVWLMDTRGREEGYSYENDLSSILD